MEQQHLTLSAPCRGHPAGAQRPHPTLPPRVQRRPGAREARTQEVVSTRRQRPLQPASVTQRLNTTPRATMGHQNPVFPQSVQGRAPGAAVDADPLRYVGPVSSLLLVFTRSLPLQ